MASSSKGEIMTTAPSIELKKNVMPWSVAVAPEAASSGERASLTASSSAEEILIIDRRRRAAGMTVQALLSAARVDLSTWARLKRGERSASPRTLARLRAALDGAPPPRPADLAGALHRVVTVRIAAALGADPVAVAATDTATVQRPTDKAWLSAARIKRMATAVLVRDLGVERAVVARALGVSRQAIHQSLAWIDEQSDDPDFAALLARIGAEVGGAA